MRQVAAEISQHADMPLMVEATDGQDTTSALRRSLITEPVSLTIIMKAAPVFVLYATTDSQPRI